MCVTFGLDCVLLDCVWLVQRRTLADVGWSCALRTCVVPSRGGEEDSISSSGTHSVRSHRVAPDVSAYISWIVVYNPQT